MENLTMYFEYQDQRGDWEGISSYKGVSKKILKLWISAAKRKQKKGIYCHIVVRDNDDPEFQVFFHPDGEIKVLFNYLKIKI